MPNWVWMGKIFNGFTGLATLKTTLVECGAGSVKRGRQDVNLLAGKERIIETQKIHQTSIQAF